jgi:ATP-binding cassette, subfamily C (CFTR/MRP), member 1
LPTHRGRRIAIMAGFWNQLSFSWMLKPVTKARHGAIGADELYFPDEYTTDHLYDEFDRAWTEEMQSEKATGKAPSLMRTLNKIYGRAYKVAGLCKVLWSIFVIAGAFYFVRSLLLFADKKKPYDQNWHGWLLTGFFFVDSYLLGASLCLLRLRVALMHHLSTCC